MTKTMKRLAGALAGAFFAVAALAQAPGVPPPGASPRIDAIRKAGVLRVGVLANAPWLVENTSGSGDTWSGPAWMLAKEYAKRLDVRLEPVPVSHETKVPVLASNQVDISLRVVKRELVGGLVETSHVHLFEDMRRAFMQRLPIRGRESLENGLSDEGVPKTVESRGAPLMKELQADELFQSGRQPAGLL